MNAVWNFPISNYSTNQGTSGSGIDQFSNYSVNNLAREIIQNSLDAKDPSKEGPVVVEFHEFTTPTSSFPADESFSEYVMKIYNQSRTKSNPDRREIEFADRIVRAMRTNKIRWLRISDFNTTGLVGVNNIDDQETPWFAFINGSGKNQKGEMSGGSKGLGKNAIFANSTAQTMLVSTYAGHVKNGKIIEEIGNIGVAKLLSYTYPLENGQLRRAWTEGIGFCVQNTEKGKEYNIPNEELLEIDPEFDRMEMGFGTDIYIPFFNGDKDDWCDILTNETIISFIPAIMDGELIVRITFDDTNSVIQIDKNTVKQHVAGAGKNKEVAKALYQVMTSPNTKTIVYDNKKGYEMTLLLLQDNLRGLGRVYQYRLPTKMKIRDEAKECSVGYTGILLVQGKELCVRLKSIEDATHSMWNIRRAKDSIYPKNELENALSIVSRFLEKECSNFGAINSDETRYFDVDGWNKEEDPSSLGVEEQKEYGLPTDEIVCNTKDDPQKNPRRRPFKKKGNVIDKDGQAETTDLDIGIPGVGEDVMTHPTGHNEGDGGEYHEGKADENYKPDDEGKMVLARKSIATSDAKMPSVNPNEGLFDLVFTPKMTGVEIEIEVLKSGINGESDKVEIVSATSDDAKVKVKYNKICLDRIEKGETYRIHLKISEHSNYIWEVNVSGKE